MNCVICETKLVEEKRKHWDLSTDEVILESWRPTGYLYCPSCGLVYKEKE